MVVVDGCCGWLLWMVVMGGGCCCCWWLLVLFIVGFCCGWLLLFVFVCGLWNLLCVDVVCVDVVVWMLLFDFFKRGHVYSDGFHSLTIRLTLYPTGPVPSLNGS